MLNGFLENASAWDGLLENGLFHVSGKIVVAGPTSLWPTELLLAGLFIIILFAIFLLAARSYAGSTSGKCRSSRTN